MVGSETHMMPDEVSEIKEHAQLNNVKISGVRYSQVDDCVAILQTVGDNTGSPMSFCSFDFNHRVLAARENTENLLV